MIPWLREKGPLFGYRVARGIFDFLSRDPRIQIEITTYEKAKAAEFKYNQSKKKKGTADSLHVDDAVVIITEPAKVEDVTSVEVAVPSVSDVKEDLKIEVVSSDEEIDPAFVFYTDEQLNQMKKIELKEILKNRGYEKGPYAPKYQDRIDDLITKIKKTQTFKARKED